ncbi:MAG: hypothetical protein KME29_15490 [Calothrix sp. FI2-JRJ7]|jgi:hypothetical protein|nr:hypothetical protein [Calothrix sp. FI2-JRJ7]
MKINPKFYRLLLFVSLLISVQPITPVKSQTSTCACIRSDAVPQPGQDNRSSGNFSTQGCGHKLRWDVAKSITFNVMEDRSAARDRTLFRNLGQNSVTNNPNKRSLYIAKPKGAAGNFDVCAYNFDDSP